jgi:hypothetical protein
LAAKPLERQLDAAVAARQELLAIELSAQRERPTRRPVQGRGEALDPIPKGHRVRVARGQLDRLRRGAPARPSVCAASAALAVALDPPHTLGQEVVEHERERQPERPRQNPHRHHRPPERTPLLPLAPLAAGGPRLTPPRVPRPALGRPLADALATLGLVGRELGQLDR